MGLLVRIGKAVDGFKLDIDWEIGNELAVLFGHSGSGKTMTLQMLSGFLKPDQGYLRLSETVLYDKSAGVDLRPQERPFGYVFQDLALFPHMTVMKNILYGAVGLPKDEKADRANYFIREFKLTGLEGRYPREISGGQKQRVAFARALVRRPKALLLDEPFSALDRPLRSEMRHFLKKVRNDFNIPVVLVTHDFEEANAIADKIIIYEQGRVAQIGSPEQVERSPVNRYVSQLVACMET